jgi:hypothetical protein
MKASLVIIPEDFFAVQENFVRWEHFLRHHGLFGNF